jgi:tetratricopeptide (TPR) repeat protein
MPVFVLGLVCLALVAATAPLRLSRGSDIRGELEHLRLSIQGERELPDLQAFITPLIGKASEFPNHQAEAEFLIGSYFFRRGELEPQTPEWLTRANQHLTRALTLSIAAGDEAMLFYRLGMTHYRQGKHLSQAMNWIAKGLELGADNPANGYAFLAEAYLTLPQPNLAAALSANQRHLEFVDDRNPEAIGKARYFHADILQRLERRAEALRELDKISPKVSAPLLAKVRLMQAACAEAEGQWANAYDYWKDLEPLDTMVPGGAGRVAYALGMVLTQLDPVDNDAIQSLWTQAVAAGGAEGQAAAIRLGHRLIVGDDYASEASLKLWTAALGAMRVSGDYKNTYLDLAKVLELFDQACERLLLKADFARCQELTNLVAHVAPPGAAEEKIARMHLRWAKDLSAQAKQTSQSSEPLLAEARARYQDAGDYFKRASLSRDAGDKVDLYWQSANCYLAARDFANASGILETFVALAQAEDLRAQGHFALAEAYQAQNQKPKARAHYLKCIELNAPPYVYRALGRLAQIEIESRRLTSAREILLQILGRNGPELERDILEQALYSLGNVLFELGDGDEGAVRLREAVRRFPNNPSVWGARQKIAEHTWERAKQIMPADPQVSADDRRLLTEAMLHKRRAYLLEAHDAFRALARDLEERYYSQKTLPMDLVVLWRTALFSVGSLKLDMGNAGEALTYFRGVQLLYKGKAESLFAARYVYASWQQVAKNAEQKQQFQPLVLETVQTALRDLDEIPKERDDEVFPSGPNSISREQWRQFLQFCVGELSEPVFRANQFR